MASMNAASVHDTSGYASIRADTFKRGKKMEEVEGTSIEIGAKAALTVYTVNGRRIVSGKLYLSSPRGLHRVKSDQLAWQIRNQRGPFLPRA